MKHSPSEVKSFSYSRTSLPSVEPDISVLCPQQFDIDSLFILNPVLTLEHDSHKIQFSVPPTMTVSSKIVSSLELFEPKLLFAFLISPIRATCPAHHTLLDFTILKIFEEVYKLCTCLRPPGHKNFTLSYESFTFIYSVSV
jgi:hypothetical protein